MEAFVANLLGATALSLSLGGVANVPAPNGAYAAPTVTAQMQACCYGYGYYGYAAPGDTTFAQVMGDGWVAGLGAPAVAQYAAPTFAALGDATFAQVGSGWVAGLSGPAVAQVGDGWVASLGAPAFAQVGAPAFAQAAPTFANLGATTFAGLGRVRTPTRPTDETTDESDAYVG